MTPPFNVVHGTHLTRPWEVQSDGRWLVRCGTFEEAVGHAHRLLIDAWRAHADDLAAYGEYEFQGDVAALRGCASDLEAVLRAATAPEEAT